MLRSENESLRQRLASYEGQRTLAGPSVGLRTAEHAKDNPKSAKRQRTRSNSAASLPTSTLNPTANPISLPSISASMLAQTDPHLHSFKASYSTHLPTELASESAFGRPIPSSYFPPSPSVSSDHSPHSASTDLAASLFPSTTDGSCGLCDDTASTQCICEDIGIGPLAMQANIPGKIRKLHHKGSCGICDESGKGRCLCEDMGLERPEVVTPISSDEALVVKDSNAIALPLKSRDKLPSLASNKVWVLDNSINSASGPISHYQKKTPAASASVALRRRLIKMGTRRPCSGDPSDCPACADDPYVS